MRIKIHFISLLPVLFALFLFSCVSKKTQKISSELGVVSNSAKFEEIELKSDAILMDRGNSNNVLLAQLEGGLAAYHNKNYEKALGLFTSADEQLTNLYFKAEVDVKQTFAEYFNKSTNRPYIGNMHDKFNVCAYALLCCLGKKDFSQARIWSNKIIHASEMANELYEKRISKIHNFKKLSSSQISKTKNKLRELHPELYEIEIYQDFINPFALGLAVCMKSSDLNDPNGIEEASQILKTLQKKTSLKWPAIMESKINKKLQSGSRDIAKIIIVSGGTIKLKKPYQASLMLTSGKEHLVEYKSIANLESGTSFNKEFGPNFNLMSNNDFIAVDSFLKANETFAGKIHTESLKISQNFDKANRSMGGSENRSQLIAGPFDMLAKSMYSLVELGASTTPADLRGWNSLPKEHHIAIGSPIDDLELNLEGRLMNSCKEVPNFDLLHIRPTKSHDHIHHFSLN